MNITKAFSSIAGGSHAAQESLRMIPGIAAVGADQLIALNQLTKVGRGWQRSADGFDLLGFMIRSNEGVGAYNWLLHMQSLTRVADVFEIGATKAINPEIILHTTNRNVITPEYLFTVLGRLENPRMKFTEAGDLVPRKVLPLYKQQEILMQHVNLNLILNNLLSEIEGIKFFTRPEVFSNQYMFDIYRNAPLRFHDLTLTVSVPRAQLENFSNVAAGQFNWTIWKDSGDTIQIIAFFENKASQNMDYVINTRQMVKDMVQSDIANIFGRLDDGSLDFTWAANVASNSQLCFNQMVQPLVPKNQMQDVTTRTLDLINDADAKLDFSTYTNLNATAHANTEEVFAAMMKEVTSGKRRARMPDGSRVTWRQFQFDYLDRILTNRNGLDTRTRHYLINQMIDKRIADLQHMMNAGIPEAIVKTVL
ncbi:MAG: hypothetical protein AAFQ94_11410 [Bacteroidota bacterium]